MTRKTILIPEKKAKGDVKKHNCYDGKQLLSDMCTGTLLWGICSLFVQKLTGTDNLYPVFFLPVLTFPALLSLKSSQSHK